jgi:hypothetical protein
MRDGRTKGALLGPLQVDVDPLVIACGLGELIDLLLGDGHPFCGGHILADTSGQFGQVCKCFHGPDFIHLSVFRVSMT